MAPSVYSSTRNFSRPIWILGAFVTAQPGSENGLDSAGVPPLPPNRGGAECFSPQDWGAGGPPEQLLPTSMAHTKDTKDTKHTKHTKDLEKTSLCLGVFV